MRCLVILALVLCASCPLIAQRPAAYVNLPVPGGNIVVNDLLQLPGGDVIVAADFFDAQVNINPNGNAAILHSKAVRGFVARYDHKGVMKWGAPIADTGSLFQSTALCVRSDKAGNLYIAGRYRGNDMLRINNGFFDSTGDPNDARERMYLLKLDPSGNELDRVVIHHSGRRGLASETIIDYDAGGFHARRPVFDVDEDGNVALLTTVFSTVNNGFNTIPNRVQGRQFTWDYVTIENAGELDYVFLQLDPHLNPVKKGLFGFKHGSYPLGLTVHDGKTYISAKSGTGSSVLYFKEEGFRPDTINTTTLTLPNNTYLSPNHYGAGLPAPVPIWNGDNYGFQFVIESLPGGGFNNLKISHTSFDMGTSMFFSAKWIGSSMYLIGNTMQAYPANTFHITSNNGLVDTLDINSPPVVDNRKGFVIKVNKDWSAIQAKSYYALGSSSQTLYVQSRLTGLAEINGQLAVYGSYTGRGILAYGTDSTIELTEAMPHKRNVFIAFADTATLGIRDVWAYEQHNQKTFAEAISSAGDTTGFWVAVGYQDSLNIGTDTLPVVVRVTDQLSLHTGTVLVRYTYRETNDDDNGDDDNDLSVATMAPAADGLTLYPNPSGGRVRIHPGSLQVMRSRLMNSQGQTLAVTDGVWKELDLSGFAPGIYYLQFDAGVETRVQKLILK